MNGRGNNNDVTPARSAPLAGNANPVRDSGPVRTGGDFRIAANEQSPAVRPQNALAKTDAGASPFKVVIDPRVRHDLRRALFELIEYHDEALAEHFSEGKLALDSYKEYIELFARSLKETMESREGVSYLLRATGFEVPPNEINMNPELRWKKGPGAFGSSLL